MVGPWEYQPEVRAGGGEESEQHKSSGAGSVTVGRKLKPWALIG